MRDDNCIFCKIANGDIPSRTLFEDDHFRVILDNGPATRGHALVLPKDHAADLFELPADTAAGAIRVAQRVGGEIVRKMGADGMNLVQNNGAVAGQTVRHFHIHLIPRYANDGQNINWNPGEPTAEELDTVLQTIVG